MVRRGTSRYPPKPACFAGFTVLEALDYLRPYVNEAESLERFIQAAIENAARLLGSAT